MLIHAKEVQELLHVKTTKAYSIVKKLNAELEKEGYLIIPGRVDENYLYKRFNIQKEGKRNEES